jgi:hypothetical protein
MKTSHYLRVALALFAAASFVSALQAQNQKARLDLEQSTDGMSNWQRVSLSAGMLNNGSIDLSAVTSSAFYRMKIVVTAPPFSSENMITVQGGTLPQSSQ